jgi:hypothetical protein
LSITFWTNDSIYLEEQVAKNEEYAPHAGIFTSPIKVVILLLFALHFLFFIE